MKKSSILILIAICLFGCSKSSKKVSITGEIEGLGTDTLYLYGMDELRDQIDTIFTKDDKFSYSTPIDTITSAFLLIKNQIEYPIFLDKGNKIKINLLGGAVWRRFSVIDQYPGSFIIPCGRTGDGRQRAKDGSGRRNQADLELIHIGFPDLKI